MTVLTWNTASDFDARLLEQSVIHESRDGHSDTEIALGHRAAFATKKSIGALAESSSIEHLNLHAGVYDATSDKTFVVFAGYRLHPQAAAYDHGTGTWDGPYEISSTNPQNNDDHSLPCIEIDGNGTLWVAWGSHNTDQYWTQSTNARDVSAWDAAKTLTDVGYTYPQWHSIGSTMYLFIRGTNNQAGYNKTSDGGTTWNGWVNLLDVSGANVNRVYVSQTYNDGTDIHLVWNYWDSNNDSIDLYYARFEVSSETLYSVDGTQVSIFPVSKATADSTFLVHDSDVNGNELQHAKLQLDGSGNPHIVFNLEDAANTTWYLNYTFWDGTSWAALTQITELKGLGDTIPEIIVNSASDIDVFTSVASDATSGGGSLEQWHYDGGSWAKVRTIMDESDSEFKFDNPLRIRNAHPDARIVFCETNNAVYEAPYLHTFVWGDSGFLMADHGSGIAYYPMDESSGTTATDVSPAGNNATINGTVTLGAAGLLGTTCFDFDGSTGYLDFSGISIDISFGFTVAVSVNPDAYPNDPTAIFQFGDTSGNNIHLQRNSSGPQLQWGYYDGSTSHHVEAGDLVTGTWARLVVVYIHDEGRWLIYKDGTLVAETAQDIDDYQAPETTISGSSNVIGARNSTSKFFDGKIEDVIIDQYPWTGYEVTEDYNAYAGGRYVSSKKVA